MKRIVVALLGVAGAIALTTTSVSAAVVCNDEGDCWRVKDKYTYPPKARVQIFDDDYVIDTQRYRWREARPGPGYWSGGVWIDF
jgi:hypothetical protein